MDFYQDTHREIQRTAARIIDAEIAPHVDEWEAAGQFPAHHVFKLFGDAGLLGIQKPQAFGGAGLDYGHAVAFAEAIGGIACGGIPMAIGVQTDMATPALARFGSDALRRDWLAPAIAGDRVACLGVSEPGAGSDVAAITTHAEKDGGDYLISGQKMWITNGIQADFMVALVNTSDGHRHSNKSLIVIPLDMPGVDRARKLDKLGMHASDTAQIYFDRVRVPQHHRIGEEGHGFQYQMMQFQEERLWAAANILPGLQETLDATIAYTRQRPQFGGYVLDHQVVQFRLAELQTEIALLRALTEQTVRRYIADEAVVREVSMLKLKGGRLSRELTDACLQYWGGMGYMAETPISRAFRDGRLSSIGGGADEVMLSVIAKDMGLQRRRGSP